ncbi:MAG TPA: hypothetical protein VE135_09535 [Pyrinomonadaceae bacterium]|nr:hypothetical protein [Pyrinomonadaceae bacterium]
MTFQNSPRHVLPAALIILGAAILSFALPFSGAQESSTPASKRNARPEQPAPPTVNQTVGNEVRYSYEFTQPQFFIHHLVVEHDGNGNGKITFEKLGEDGSVVEPIELSAPALARITGLWQALSFLDSDTNYQSSKQFPHLGTMRLRMEQGTRNRTAEFNWTHNESAAALVNEYRHIADQAILVFDISVARENQPLNAPKLMEQLESLLKRGGLSDAQQLVPLLNEISTDEHVPLIARNHAKRLLKQILK